MLAYPIVLEDDDGTLLATSPDFPELTTFGDDPEEAIARAVDALEEAIAARIHDRRDVPAPSRGETYAILPTLTSVKVMLLPGNEGPGRRQGGAGPSSGVAYAAGGPGAGRSAPVATGHDGHRPGSHRTAVARERYEYRRPGHGGRWKSDRHTDHFWGMTLEPYRLNQWRTDAALDSLGWWAYFDDRQNRLRALAGDSVGLLLPVDSTICGPMGRASIQGKGA